MTDKEKLIAIRTEVERRERILYGTHAGRSSDVLPVLEELLSFIDSLQKEPKECMYSKDQYTDEDRKVLCDGCKEECKFNKKEEPVSEGRDIFDNCLKSEEKFILPQKISGNIDCENCLYSSACALGDIQECIIDKSVSEDLEKVVEEIVDPTVLNAYGVKEIANRLRRTMIEPVSEDLEEVIEQLAENARKHKAETSSPFFSQTDYRQGVIDGAQWQKEKEYTCYEEAFEDGAKWKVENLWKPADGDDLPIIDREVIALLDNGKVVFAHRPPEYWDGKNIVTGKVTRNYPKTYDKGGWNIPNIVFWLNLELPKEKED